MENYVKSRTVEAPAVCPFPGLAADTPEVRVKDGSKIRNLMRYALSRVEARPRGAEDEGRPAAPPPEEEDGATEGRQEAPGSGLGPGPGRTPCRQIVFTASGKGVSKAITCAEIVKRRVKGLHQLTRLLFSTVQEVWEPLEPAAGLDSLTVSRNLPNIWILLSRDPLDASQPGYQAPGRYDALWAQTAAREEAAQKPGHKRKKGAGGGGGGGGGGRGRGPGRQTGRPREPPKGQS
ncbi:ribonuclease P protein subunit p25-like protein [Centropristis striata]|uniref:ribonuclease P protein subunit p25-like protein n=1 Tax=Centropristis striata TaxID=184440 RepID=UPI0027E0B18A|nr:ribonuclease P protein subunit p25-like protein [Centropristis striata]